eukprot:5459479-Prymnesium_polylepis.1
MEAEEQMVVQAEPRAAVAAQPHKRRVVPAATAVAVVGEGGGQPGEAAAVTNDEPAGASSGAGCTATLHIV